MSRNVTIVQGDVLLPVSEWEDSCYLRLKNCPDHTGEPKRLTAEGLLHLYTVYTILQVSTPVHYIKITLYLQIHNPHD